MSARAARLAAEANDQLDELARALAGVRDETLRAPCRGRAKLGDGSIGTVARHTIGNYIRTAGFLSGHATAPSVDLASGIDAAKEAVAALSGLEDAALDAVPAAGAFRFADGNRTTEQIVTRVLAHQRHQLDAIVASLR
jgi:hypothetical protein